MNRIKLIVSVLLFSGVAYQCNPVRLITMTNKTVDTVGIVWTLNEDSLMNNPFLLSNSKKLKFTLYPPKSTEIKMSFGPGAWKPKDVEKLAGYLESLEITSSRQKIKIDSLPLLKDFLLARRKGIGDAKIEIVISD